ncbi:MAG: hypothetical protein QMB98_00615 [Flaviflexus sp.]
MKRLPAALLLVIGVAVLVIGIGSATWWKPSTTIVANTASSSQSGIIATDAGVLELVDDTVRVTARAEGTTVEMVVASTSTANLWLGDEPHVSVTGLENWQTLATTDPENDTAPEGELSLQGSDLFNPENFISGDGSAELFFTVPDGDWTLIAIGQDGTTPELTITWERDVQTPWSVPLAILGIVLLAAGSALFLYQSQKKTVAKRRAESQERSERRERADSTDTTIIPAIKDGSAKDRSAQDGAAGTDGGESEVRTDVKEETGGIYGAGILPASPRAAEFRAAADAEADVEASNEDETESADEADGSSDAAGFVVADDSESAVEESLVEAGDGDDSAEELTETDEALDASEATEENLDGEASRDETDDETVGEFDGEDSSASSLDKESETASADESDDREDGTRGSSDEWRSLWGFGPKE